MSMKKMIKGTFGEKNDRTKGGQRGWTISKNRGGQSDKIPIVQGGQPTYIGVHVHLVQCPPVQGVRGTTARRPPLSPGSTPNALTRKEKV